MRRRDWSLRRLVDCPPRYRRRGRVLEENLGYFPKSLWTRDGVGPRWPWYFEPASLLP